MRTFFRHGLHGRHGLFKALAFYFSGTEIIPCLKSILINIIIGYLGENIYLYNALLRTFGKGGEEIVKYMANLEQFINDTQLSQLDPLIKMAIIHHQFESIHPFYDRNGRTGRIINILYLVISDLLDLPILYLSKYITHNKGEYYQLILAVRDKNTDNAKEWEAWILFNVSSTNCAH